MGGGGGDIYVILGIPTFRYLVAISKLHDRGGITT